MNQFKVIVARSISHVTKCCDNADTKRLISRIYRNSDCCIEHFKLGGVYYIDIWLTLNESTYQCKKAFTRTSFTRQHLTGNDIFLIKELRCSSIFDSGDRKFSWSKLELAVTFSPSGNANRTTIPLTVYCRVTHWQSPFVTEYRMYLEDFFRENEMCLGEKNDNRPDPQIRI
uniref:Uncharacterized protein n=1 Tax=Romanomermis culicivorax TaxID=13658 RepID=A0A915L5X6_ROMCU